MKRPRATARGERSIYWVADDVGIELLHGRYLSHRFVPHTHDEYSIGVVLEGALGFNHERGDDIAGAGMLCVVNPGERHTGFPGGDAGWRYRNFFVPAGLLARIAAALGGDGRPPEFPGVAVHDPDLAATLLGLHRTLERSRDRLAREAATVDGLSALVARHALARRPPPPLPRNPGSVGRARALIQERFAESLSLAELARAAGMSRFHFLRLFRSELGLTPHAYLLQVRVERARQALSRGRSIAEAALECGFADQSHLTRRFKGVMGLSPGEYARAAAARTAFG